MLLDHPAHFHNCCLDVVQRYRRDTIEAVGSHAAEIRHPVVVGTARRSRELGVLDRDKGDTDRREKHGNVYALRVHVLETGMRIVAAGAQIIPRKAARQLWARQTSWY